jgi:hypothetical protein
LPAPAPTPLARRDPAMVWRAVAAVSIVINVLLMYLVAVR